MNTDDRITAPAGVTDELRKFLFSESPAGLDRLVRWLQGYDLPSYRYGGNPASWLMAAIPLPERNIWRPRLAARLAELLDERQPDVNPLGVAPEDLLENLFSMAASLRCPDELGPALLRCYRRHETTVGKLLRDDDRLRVAFGQALMWNQHGEELSGLWPQLIRREKGLAADADALSAVQALLLLPHPRRAGDCLSIHVLIGLGEYARALEPDRFRRRSFSEAIDYCLEQCAVTDASRRLRSDCQAQAFPDWALESLPVLTEEDEIEFQRQPARLVWRETARVLVVAGLAQATWDRPLDEAPVLVFVMIRPEYRDRAMTIIRDYETIRTRSRYCSDHEFFARFSSYQLPGLIQQCSEGTGLLVDESRERLIKLQKELEDSSGRPPPWRINHQAPAVMV